MPLELEALDLDAPGRRRRRDRRLPARRRRAGGRRAARARRAGRRPARPTSGCATAASTRSGTARTARPSCSAEASTGCPSSTATTIAGADLVANPGCYPTAALLALAPLARAGLIGDVVIDAKSGVLGRRARADAGHALRLRRREHRRLQGRPPPPHAGDRAGARRPGADVTVTFTPHLLPLDQGELVSCYVTPARDADAGEVAALYDDAYAREPCVELRTGPPGVRDVRDTNICRIDGPHRPAHRPGPRLRAIDNLWKGAASQAVQNLEPDVRPRRDGRGSHEPGRPRSPRAGSTRPTRVTEVPTAGCAAGFRAAGVAAGIKPSGELDVALLVSDEPGHDQRRALHALGRARRARAAVPGRAAGSTRCGPSSSTPATPTPRPAAAGWTTPRGCRARRRWRPACTRTGSRSPRPA